LQPNFLKTEKMTTIFSLTTRVVAAFFHCIDSRN